MAQSNHPRYAAADRHERKYARRPRPTARRTGTRSAVVALALQEA